MPYFSPKYKYTDVVTPLKNGVQCFIYCCKSWIPAFAGMTDCKSLIKVQSFDTLSCNAGRFNYVLDADATT